MNPDNMLDTIKKQEQRQHKQQQKQLDRLEKLQRLATVIALEMSSNGMEEFLSFHADVYIFRKQLGKLSDSEEYQVQQIVKDKLQGYLTD